MTDKLTTKQSEETTMQQSTRSYTFASLKALEDSHAKLLRELTALVRSAEREAAEAGEKASWLKTAKAALATARRIVK